MPVAVVAALVAAPLVILVLGLTLVVISARCFRLLLVPSVGSLDAQCHLLQFFES